MTEWLTPEIVLHTLTLVATTAVGWGARSLGELRKGQKELGSRMHDKFNIVNVDLGKLHNEFTRLEAQYEELDKRVTRIEDLIDRRKIPR